MIPSFSMPQKSTLPPAMRAVLRAGGPAGLVKALGGGVKISTVDQWLRRGRVPAGYILKVSSISGISVAEFLDYEAKLFSNKVENAKLGDKGDG